MKMQKRILALVLAVCLLVGGLPLSAVAVDSDFTISGSVLTKYNGPGGDVVIPNGITSIGESAFYNCRNLISITIPDSVTSIGDETFRDCTGLISIITFPPKDRKGEDEGRNE